MKNIKNKNVIWEARLFSDQIKEATGKYELVTYLKGGTKEQVAMNIRKMYPYFMGSDGHMRMEISQIGKDALKKRIKEEKQKNCFHDKAIANTITFDDKDKIKGAKNGIMES